MQTPEPLEDATLLCWSAEEPTGHDCPRSYVYPDKQGRRQKRRVQALCPGSALIQAACVISPSSKRRNDNGGSKDHRDEARRRGLHFAHGQHSKLCRNSPVLSSVPGRRHQVDDSRTGPRTSPAPSERSDRCPGAKGHCPRDGCGRVPLQRGMHAGWIGRFPLAK